MGPSVTTALSLACVSLGSPCLDRAHSQVKSLGISRLHLTPLENGNKTMKMPHPFKATALFFLFLKATVVTSECEHEFEWSCTAKGFTFTVSFINTSGSSEYKASTRFFWDLDDETLDDETITDTYSRGEWEQVSHTFTLTQGSAGTSIVGFSLVFGEGSCEKRFDQVYEYVVGSQSCDFVYIEGTHEPGPPESATPEPATPEPTAPEPITPAPIVPVVTDVRCCLR